MSAASWLLIIILVSIIAAVAACWSEWETQERIEKQFRERQRELRKRNR